MHTNGLLQRVTSVRYKLATTGYGALLFARDAFVPPILVLSWFLQ